MTATETEPRIHLEMRRIIRTEIDMPVAALANILDLDEDYVLSDAATLAQDYFDTLLGDVEISVLIDEAPVEDEAIELVSAGLMTPCPVTPGALHEPNGFCRKHGVYCGKQVRRTVTEVS